MVELCVFVGVDEKDMQCCECVLLMPIYSYMCSFRFCRLMKNRHDRLLLFLFLIHVKTHVSM